MTAKKKANLAPGYLRKLKQPTPLLNSPSHYRGFVEYMPAAMAMVDCEMRYLAVSGQWQNQYGEAGVNLIGCSHEEWFPNLPDAWSQNIQRSFRGNHTQWELECCITRPNHKIQWVKWIVQPWLTENETVGGFIIQAQALTEPQSWENVIQHAQISLEQAGDAIFGIAPNGQVCDVNPAACELLGYPKAELLKLRIHEINPDFCTQVWQEHYQQLKQQGSVTFESSHQTQAGEIMAVEIRGKYLEISPPQTGSATPAVKLPFVTWSVRDIRQHKAACQAITASRDQLKAVLNAVPGLVSWISSDLRYLGVNQHLAQAYNVPPEAFIGQEVGFLENSPEFNQFVYQFFASQDWTLSQEIIADVQGVPRTYLIVAQKYQRGKAAVFVGLDITERLHMEMELRQSKERETFRSQELEAALTQLQRTQTQLIQAEKMSFLGQLVAGVAHEVNNPVNFIFGNLSHAQNYFQDLIELLELYQNYYPKPPTEIETILEDLELEFIKQDLPQMLDSMQLGAERIRDVVRSLRLFSHLDQADMKPVNIHEGLDSTLLILQNRLQAKGGRSSIGLEKTYGNLPHVYCCASQLNQVFMNILITVIERLEAAMAAKTVKDPTIQVQTQFVDPDIISISITENSPGMTAAECDQVFQPSMTPATPGKATGLGLSIAYHLMVEQQRGTLECFSQEQGTEFLITIPHHVPGG